MIPTTDIDECAMGADDCDQECTNNESSFTCSCASGYTLAEDGKTCICKLVHKSLYAYHVLGLV